MGAIKRITDGTQTAQTPVQGICVHGCAVCSRERAIRAHLLSICLSSAEQEACMINRRHDAPRAEVRRIRLVLLLSILLPHLLCVGPFSLYMPACSLCSGCAGPFFLHPRSLFLCSAACVAFSLYTPASSFYEGYLCWLCKPPLYARALRGRFDAKLPLAV